MRRLVTLCAFGLATTACDKSAPPAQQPTAPTPEPSDDELPDYSKSACVGQKKTVKTAGGDVATTCKAEGKLFRLYVDDALAAGIGAGDLQAAAVTLDRVAETTAHDPMTGTVENVFQVLGAPAPTSLDGGKLAIFAVADPGPGITAANRGTQLEALHRVDAESSIDSLTNASRAAKAVAHAVVIGADSDEEAWLVESLSWAGAIAAGQYGGDKFVDAFLAEPNRAWGPGATETDPGACLLFGAFLFERFGAQAIKELTNEPANGWESVEKVLGKGSAEARRDLFEKFMLTIWFTDPGTGYGFKFSGMPQAGATIVKGEPKFDGTAKAWGASFYMLNPGAPLPITFTTQGEAFAFLGLRTADGVERVHLRPGVPHRADLTNVEMAMLGVSATADAAYSIALSEDAAKAADRAAEKARKQAEKDAKKKAKEDAKAAKAAGTTQAKTDDKAEKKADDKAE
jgi:hypothetical protein